MRCPDCHHVAPDGSPFCTACGSVFAGAATDSSVRTFSPTGPQSAIAAVSGAAAVTASPVALGAMPSGYVFSSRYRIDRLLGAGGMGAVYQAWDQALDLPVALKVIRPDIIGTPATEDFERRFKQELLMARHVTHRNVTRIHDLGESGGIKYITMQYVEGTDLATLMQQGPLPFDRVLAFAKQLVSGISAAHDAGVVHRDLKPQNILIDTADNLYISDFGLAKSLETTLAGITRTGELIGTPRYISPEQIVGQPADGRSDLYAVGLMLFEMATGKSPFLGNSAIEQMFQRVQEPPQDPKVLNPGLPDYFCRAIGRCLQREPEARYQSARELLADLESERAAPVKSHQAAVSIVLPLPRTQRAMIVAAIVAVATIAAAVPIARRYALPSATDAATTSVPAGAQKHIAILPFRVVGNEESLAPIGAGIEESLSAKLFQVPAVNLASAAAVERAAAKESLTDIARELGATLLVSGTVQGTDADFRVAVTLDDVGTGTRVWAQEFSGVAGDLLTIEDQIYGRLVSALNLELTSEDLARAVSHPTENIEAYQLYLRGRNAMRGQQDVNNVQAAIGFYEDALKKDAGFARAYAGISDAALRMYRATKQSAWLEGALSSALQAQRLDEKLVEVHLALGSVYQATGKTSEAIAELTAASELAPSSDDVFRRLGRAYLSTGRGNEAIAAYEKAVTLNPYYWASYNALGAAHMQLGSYGEAADALRKVIELEPRNVNGHNDLGAAYLQIGRFDEAAASFKKALELQPLAQTYTNLGIAYAYGGKHDAAVPMFEKAVELSPHAEMFIGNLGDGYRWAGNAAKAVAAYDKAIALALKDLQVNPRNAAARGNLALYYAKKGEHARAARMISDARTIDRASVNLTYAAAVINVVAGQTPLALAAIEEALAAGYPLSAAQHDPDLRPLTSSPEFTQLTAKFRPK